MNTATLKSLIRSGLVVLLAVSGMRAAAQIDCLGVDGGPALPGTPCDDAQPFTNAGLWNAACQCIGYCDNWDMPSYYPGEACDDYDAMTMDDVVGPDCVCHGYCWFSGWPFTPCDDGDPQTIDDMNDQWGCSCYGWSDSRAGRVFLDVDLDGAFSGSDLPIQNRLVQAGWGPVYSLSNDSGMFYFRVTPTLYQLTAAAGGFDTLAAPVSVTDLSGPGITSSGHELAMNPTALQSDLSVHMTARNPRPGFYNELWVICRNEGSQFTDGTLSVQLDSQQTYSNSQPAGTLNGNTLTWQVPVLGLGEVFTAHIWIYTPPSVPLGTNVVYSANVQTTPQDAVPENDNTGVVPTVVGAYDPNDIQVTPDLLTAEELAVPTPVTYTIRFQNTGTWLAENVRIADVLPPLVHPGSFEFVASSHPCHAQLDNSLLEFRFDNIMLPDSNANEPESHGWVMFRMTPQNFLLPGAQVYNSASIFFDFNDPIHTNTTIFEVEDLSTSVFPIVREELKLWPNPARDVLNISVARSLLQAHVQLLDLHGRRVLGSDRPLVNATMEITVGMLAEGLYTLRIEHAGGTLARRFVVSR